MCKVELKIDDFFTRCMKLVDMERQYDIFHHIGSSDTVKSNREMINY